MLYVALDRQGAWHAVHQEQWAYTVCRERTNGMSQVTEVAADQRVMDWVTCERCIVHLASTPD